MKRENIPEQPPAEQTSLGSYGSYGEAQGVVDYLADHRFEVLVAGATPWNRRVRFLTEFRDAAVSGIEAGRYSC